MFEFVSRSKTNIILDAPKMEIDANATDESDNRNRRDLGSWLINISRLHVPNSFINHFQPSKTSCKADNKKQVVQEVSKARKMN
jgi:hypothetical protein